MFCSISYSQPVKWMKYFDPTGRIDRGIEVVATPDSGYVFLSNTTIGMCLIKTNYLGIIVWQKFFADTLGTAGRSMCLTKDSGFAIGAQSFLGSMEFIKIDKNGNLNWVRLYISPSQSRAWSVKTTRDNGYILCGDVYPNGSNEVYVVKTDSLGFIQWDKTYSGSFGTDIIQSSNGYYYLVGSDPLRKLDSLGNEIYSYPVVGKKIIQSSTGYIYVGGGYGQFFLAKVDTIGNVIFQNNYFTLAFGFGMCIDSRNDIILSGSIESDTGTVKPNLDILLTKFDSSGNVKLSKVISLGKTPQGYVTQEGIFNIKTTKDNGYIGCGSTNYPSGNELNVRICRAGFIFISLMQIIHYRMDRSS